MPGLFDQMLTPRARQETVLRKALEARRDAWTGDHLYRGAGDLLLRHGQFFSGNELPAEYDVLKGPEGRCFENALHACKSVPALRYFEGVYDIGGGHYTPHAWAVTQDGELLELTLPTDAATRAIAHEHDSRLPFLPLEQWGYWGAEFHPEFVEAVWATQEGYVGILDRPALDTDPNATEWREDWPVLRTPYSPLRRTLASRALP